MSTMQRPHHLPTTARRNLVRFALVVVCTWWSLCVFAAGNVRRGLYLRAEDRGAEHREKDDDHHRGLHHTDDGTTAAARTGGSPARKSKRYSASEHRKRQRRKADGGSLGEGDGGGAAVGQDSHSHQQRTQSKVELNLARISTNKRRRDAGRANGEVPSLSEVLAQEDEHRGPGKDREDDVAEHVEAEHEHDEVEVELENEAPPMKTRSGPHTIKFDAAPEQHLHPRGRVIAVEDEHEKLESDLHARGFATSGPVSHRRRKIIQSPSR